MTTSVSTSYTDDELDVLLALALLERRRGRSPASTMQGEIVRERLAHVMRHDRQVRELVELRRAQRRENQGQQSFPPLRVIQGGQT